MTALGKFWASASADRLITLELQAEISSHRRLDIAGFEAGQPYGPAGEAG